MICILVKNMVCTYSDQFHLNYDLSIQKFKSLKLLSWMVCELLALTTNWVCFLRYPNRRFQPTRLSDFLFIAQWFSKVTAQQEFSSFCNKLIDSTLWTRLQIQKAFRTMNLLTLSADVCQISVICSKLNVLFTIK